MICRHGSVYLVGAGPGDPELITVRGLRLIQHADTIVHDRLIPMELLKEARENANVIDVGKYPDHHRISQTEINEILVRQARQGDIVVRLKGGDPFVFGRGQEELEVCRNAGIPCHVIPGVSSAIAGPAAAGIPVTFRGIARSFSVVTGHTAPELVDNDVDLSALAQLDTIVLLMARRKLRQITTDLIQAGRSPDTPVACIEKATFQDQRVTYSTLYGIADQIDQLGMQSPMVTVIGEVASMVNPDLVEWPEDANEHYFALEFGE
ncbi:MAG: uroporphyrinogen-III C-methyltransferase [Planctomycetota bacterium]